MRPLLAISCSTVPQWGAIEFCILPFQWAEREP